MHTTIESDRQIRIKDIAKKAGVSIGTVDRVLHNRGEVADVTRTLILKIIEESGYQPNLMASTLASKKTIVIASLLPAPPTPDAYWNKPLTGIIKRISEIGHFGINLRSFTFRQDNPVSFSQQTGKIIELHPDGVVMAPFFFKESITFITALKEKNIPFVFIDSEIRDCGQIGYIGQNSFRSGLVAGKLIDMLTPFGGKIMVLHFAREMENQNHLVQREKGFYEWFKDRNGSNRLFTLEIPDFDSENWADRLFRKINEENVKGIFVTNSKVFIVCHLLKARNLSGIRVIGHDLISENAECLREGTVDFLICQHPEQQGYEAVDYLFRHIVRKGEIDKENYTSIDIVTKETVDFYKEF